MSTITTLPSAINASKAVIDTNFANLNTDKVETSTYTAGLATKQATLVSGTNIKTINGSSVLGSGDLVVSGGASTFLALTDTPSSYTGQAFNVAQVNAGETALQFVTLSGGGDALTANPLSQFSSTTSLQLKNTISDETGSGALVFATSPTLVTPALGVATATSINSAIITSGTLNGSVTGTNTGDQTTITGNAGTATTLQTSRTIAGVSFNGSANIAIASTSLSDTAIIALLASTQTLTNKRVSKRVVVTTQSATPAINTDNGDIFQITGLAQAITSFTTNLTGTPLTGDMMIIQITDNGTARALTFGASFASTTVALPTTTVISTMLRIGFQRNNANTVWDCIAVA